MRRVLPALALGALSACGASPAASVGDDVVVFAAASLTDAFEELAAGYTAETGVEVILSFDASSTLRAQIAEGAPADLFVSADVANPQQLADEGLTDGDPSTFAANGLAIVVPADGDPAVTTWNDLADDGIRIVAAGEDVPISRYAVELVETLARLPDAPGGFADAYAGNVVSREDNVRAVLAKIELGEGDAGIVYETDAASSDDVATVPIPPEASVVADYAFVILADASAATGEFADWLLGDTAGEILRSYGFRPPA